MAVWCTCYGIVTLRQQPQTAKGVLFVSRADTTGVVQIIVFKSVRERGAAAIEAAGRAGALAARGRRGWGTAAAARAAGRGDEQEQEFPLRPRPAKPARRYGRCRKYAPHPISTARSTSKAGRPGRSSVSMSSPCPNARPDAHWLPGC